MADLHSTIDTRLDANGEPDPDRRATLVGRVWAENGRLVDPPVDGTGRAGISEVAAVAQSAYPGHTFRRTSGIDEHHYRAEAMEPKGPRTGADRPHIGVANPFAVRGCRPASAAAAAGGPG